MKGDLEARSLTLKTEASQVADKLDGKSFTVLRQASESGQLFGGDEATIGETASGPLCNAPRRIHTRSPPMLWLVSEDFTKTTSPSSSSSASRRMAGC